MVSGGMLYDAQTKTSSAKHFRTAFVDTIEAFENTFFFPIRYADTIVLDIQDNSVGFKHRLDLYADNSVVSVVFDGIVYQVIDHFVDYRTHSIYEA